MNPGSDPSRHSAGVAEDAAENARARPRLAARSLRCAPGAALATAALLGSVICAGAIAADDRPGTAAGDERNANAVEASGILPRLDALLDNLKARIEDLRGQAEQMLDHADAATGSDEQMRFEEMYGKLVAAAEKLEEERDRLRSMRDELAVAGGGQRP